LFKKPENKPGVFPLPYYMVFAIATSSAVLVYSTEETRPICAMGNFHYASLTDLSWRGANLLAVSSSDGFCSFMNFQDNKLGEIYEPTG
jgi:chromatin assembly factor 1 subunit B